MQANPEPAENDLKLELVQVLFRHGARTPVQEELRVYQFNDDSAYEKWGFGQLTNGGKKQEYEIGLFLRERYKNFLSEHYNFDEVYAYTTDIHRTKMSLQLVLAGLYAPIDHQVWNPDLKWSPIPYQCAPAALDILMRGYTVPRYKKLRHQAYQSEEYRKKIAGCSDFLAFLKAQTKLDCCNTIGDAAGLCGTLLSDERMNLPLPAWYKPEMKEKIDELVGFIFDCGAFTLELKKVGIGILIKTFIENMNLKETQANPRQIYLYSGHDFNVALYTRAHNIEEFKYPDFGCSLILEKLRDSNNRIYVRLLGREGNGALVTLKLGNYKEFCPIEEYLKIVEPVIPSESEVDELLADVTIANLRNLIFDDFVVKPLYNKL